MSVQCAMVTFFRAITVAAGRFAPGHLGELTRHVPFELVDAVLEETGPRRGRVRKLPARVGVYFVLALGLFERVGYARVWDKLVAGLRVPNGPSVAAPSERALRDLRRRVGVAPSRRLFDTLSVPLATPRTPGASYRGYRTVAFDGCNSIKIADSDRNRGWLGKIRHRQAWAGYPTIRLMALVETGTRGLLAARFGPIGEGGEVSFATKLLHRLGPDALLLADRGFDSGDLMNAVNATGAKFLIRLTATRRPPVLDTYSDGSYRSVIDDLPVRVIDATVTVTTDTGERITGRWRLATTLLDHRRHPARELVTLYHERWEIESAFYALRHTILDGRVLRSRDPAGVRQELWGLLCLYQALRMAMVDAVTTRDDLDPDRASFTVAVEHARVQLTNAANVIGDPHDRLGAIGHALLANPMPRRRPRLSVRKVKCSTSRYASRPSGDPRPATSARVTSTTITTRPPTRTPPPALRRRPHHQPGHSPRERVLALLASEPDRHRHWRDIGQTLDVTNLGSLRARLSTWVREGLIDRPIRGVYAHLPSPATP